MKNEPEEDVFSERLDLRLWSRVFRHALPYKRLLVPLAVSAVAIALVDASFALVTRWAVDDVVSSPDSLSLGPQIAAYTFLTLALGLGVLFFIISAGGLANHMSHDIRKECFKRIQELEFAYFDHRPTGWLISRLTSDCDKLSRIIAWGQSGFGVGFPAGFDDFDYSVSAEPGSGLVGAFGVASLDFCERLFPEEAAPEFAGYAEI